MMEEKIKEIIKKELQAQVLDIKRITEGYSHYMYNIKIDKEPYEIIIRFSNNTKKNVNLEKEKWVMEKMRENNIPAPEILGFYYKEGEEGYMIIEKFRGERLDLIWNSIEKNEKLQIVEEIGELMRKIHEIKLEKFGGIEDNGRIKSDEAFKFRKQGEEMKSSPFLREVLKDFFYDLGRLLSYKTVDPKFVSKFVFYISKNLDKFDYGGKPTFVHSDFSIGHVFVKKIGGKYEIEGLIDFEFARSSSPEYDFIKLHREGFFDDEEIKKALEDSYGKINEKAVEVLRVGRDLGFAQAVLESGNRELCEEVLTKIEKRIEKDINSI